MYLRNRENALGDLHSATQEFGLCVADASTDGDEFNRPMRILRVRLETATRHASPPISDEDRALVAFRVLRTMRSMGWDAVLRLDGQTSPRIAIRLDGPTGQEGGV